jgi:hypothetical protein
MERSNREKFLGMVRDMMSLDSRKVTWKTNYREFVELVKEDKRYLDLLGQSYPYTSKFEPNNIQYRSSSH